ncbi:hypothetical protein DFH06DRAFT_1178732 [Mycena polygramma]|nr:hypothetical protein DFH06DRAFT_1178732 [Mycena polygramma]
MRPTAIKNSIESSVPAWSPQSPRCTRCHARSIPTPQKPERTTSNTRSHSKPSPALRRVCSIKYGAPHARSQCAHPRRILRWVAYAALGTPSPSSHLTTQGAVDALLYGAARHRRQREHIHDQHGQGRRAVASHHLLHRPMAPRAPLRTQHRAQRSHPTGPSPPPSLRRGRGLGCIVYPAYTAAHSARRSRTQRAIPLRHTAHRAASRSPSSPPPSLSSRGFAGIRSPHVRMQCARPLVFPFFAFDRAGGTAGADPGYLTHCADASVRRR